MILQQYLTKEKILHEIITGQLFFAKTVASALSGAWGNKEIKKFIMEETTKVLEEHLEKVIRFGVIKD